MSEQDDTVEEVVQPRRSSRQRTVKKLDDDYEYDNVVGKKKQQNTKSTPKKNQATKRKAPEEEQQDEEADVKPSTILLSSPPPPKETKKPKKRKTKKEKEEEQKESLKLREKLHKEMEEAKENEKRNMEELIRRENEKKKLEEEAKMKQEEVKNAEPSTCPPTSSSSSSSSKKPSDSTPQNDDMSDEEEVKDESCGFSDLERLISVADNSLEKPVLIHGGFIKVLKPHQLEGIRFCWKHISMNLGCVLAHSMGLGKTLQMIALAHTLMISSNLKTRNFLIVCPKSVILNWDAEFRKWLDKCVNARISIRTIKDRDKTNDSRLKKLEKWKRKGGVLILSFQMFHRFLGHYSKAKDYESLAVQKNTLEQYKVKREIMKSVGTSTLDLDATIKDLAEQIEKSDKRLKQKEDFEFQASDLIIKGTQLVIVDEAHRMCSNTDIYINQALNRIETPLRIALTGTPIQNNLMEYYAMINWIRKGYWTNEEFFGFFSKPIQSGMRKDSDEKAVEEMKKSSFLLVKELENFIHRRDQSVLRDSLPPKHEYVVSFRVNPLQAKLYKAFADARQKEERKYGGGSASGSGLFDPKFYSQPLTREQIDSSSKTLFYLSVLLNKITNHPDLVRMYCARRDFTFEDAMKHPGVFITREEMQEKRYQREEEDEMDDEDEPETPPKIKKSESPLKTSSVKNEPLKRESSSTSVKNEPISLDDDDEDLFSLDLLGSISSQPKTPASSTTTKKESPFSLEKTKPKKEEKTTKKTKNSKAKKEEDNDTPKSKKNKIKSSLDEEEELEEQFDDMNTKAENDFGNNLYWATPVLAKEYKMNSARNSPKMEFLLRIIEKCYLNNEKILVFTQYVEMLDVMEGVFKNTPIVVGTEEVEDGVVPVKKNLKKGDDYLRLDGSISGRARQDLVDSFTTESTAHVFIISTKAGGLGINLVAATRVVIFDACWNDTWDKQALFRAYRYGQTKPVFVYRFVTYGSAEEKIFNLSTAKAWLAKRIVDDKTPDLIMKKGDLEILNQALSIEETMRDKLLLNPKQYQEDTILKDLLGVNWEYSEDVIDPLKPVHINIDDDDEKAETKKKADTFYPEEEEDTSGEFNVQRKIKSVFRYDSLFVENESLRLGENEQERSISEYEQKRKEARENPGKLLAEIMADDLYDPSALISPSALLPPSQSIIPGVDGPLTPTLDSSRLGLLARLQQFIQAQDNAEDNETSTDTDREATTTLNSMWQQVSSNERVMKLINKLKKRRQRVIASQGLAASPPNYSQTPPSTPNLTMPPTSFTFDALNNTSPSTIGYNNPSQFNMMMMPPPSSSSVASSSRAPSFSVPIVSLDEPIEISPLPSSTANKRKPSPFNNSISLDSDDDE